MSDLRTAWNTERAAAVAARTNVDPGTEWSHLERAHILSQPMVVPHIRTHLAMFGAARRRHDRRKMAGQALRMALAGPGSLTGRYPVGNTGGADVSAMQAMPIPDDLRALLESAGTTKETR